MDMLKEFSFWQNHLFGLHLHLDCSKFDLSSLLIPSVPVVKLKDCFFQF